MFQITNQKPVVISPLYTPNLKGDLDIPEIFKNLLAQPLYTPVSNAPVTISYNQQDQTPDDIANLLLQSFDENVNPQAQSLSKDLLSQTCLYYPKTSHMLLDSFFSVQAGHKHKLPEPTPSLIYTPATDVIPAAKAYLAGTKDEDWFFANLAYYAKPKVLGIAFKTETDFDDFKTFVDTQVNLLLSQLPADTIQQLKQFNKLKLNGLTESLLLRLNDGESLGEYSFARVIATLTMSYVQQQPQTTCLLPFSIDELILPKALVFVNVDQHAKASETEITDEWDMINKSRKSPLKVVSKNQITRMTQVQRDLKRATTAVQNLAQKRKQKSYMAKRVKFKKRPPTGLDISRQLLKIIKHMTNVNRSQNVFKASRKTFNKANRRNPDDYNLMGVSTSTAYKPDIHLYIDTSGSISEENYQDTVKTCIALAKKLDINLYFNSFSHIMSAQTLLKVKGKSKQSIYHQFQRTPKVTGGTNLSQIWEYILRSDRRKRELSIIITDFEWSCDNQYHAHPKNLYYLPISKADWSSIKRYVKDVFLPSTEHVLPTMRKHLLF